MTLRQYNKLTKGLASAFLFLPFNSLYVKNIKSKYMEKDLLDSDKQLLLVDICARLPYGVILKTDNVFPQKLEGISFDKDTFVFLVSDGGFTLDYMDCKPYLFPLSSMTEEQREEYHSFFVQSQRDFITPNNAVKLFDWLLKNHFDYRGLIEKGLAIDATGLNIY